MTREFRFQEALETIANFPPPQRQLLCQLAIEYFASAEGMAKMAYLAELPQGHYRLFVARQRLAYAVLHLILTGKINEWTTTKRIEAKEE